MMDNVEEFLIADKKDLDSLCESVIDKYTEKLKESDIPFTEDQLQIIDNIVSILKEEIKNEV